MLAEKVPADCDAGLTATASTISAAGAWHPPTRVPLGRSTDAISIGSGPVQVQQRGHPQTPPTSLCVLPCSPMLARIGSFAVAGSQCMLEVRLQLPFAAHAAYHSKAKSKHRDRNVFQRRHMPHINEEHQISMELLRKEVSKCETLEEYQTPHKITQMMRKVWLDTYNCSCHTGMQM